MGLSFHQKRPISIVFRLQAHDRSSVIARQSSATSLMSSTGDNARSHGRSREITQPNPTQCPGHVAVAPDPLHVRAGVLRTWPATEGD